MTIINVPRPAILTQIPAGQHAVIEASAGTGKTYTLEHLIVDLLLRTGVGIENLLVVTFTERATIDLRVRVRRKLREILDRGEEQTPSESEVDSWPIDQAARERLTTALAGFDGASISTIHGFCQRVLTEHAFLNQRMFGETAVDGRASFDLAFREAMRRELSTGPEHRPYLEAWLSEGRTIAKLEEALYEGLVRRGEMRPALDEARLRQVVASFPAQLALGPRFSIDLRKAKLEPAVIDRLSVQVRALVEAVQAAQTDGDIVTFVRATEGQLSGDGVDFLRRYFLEPRLPKGPAREVQAALRELTDSYVPFEAAVLQALLPAVRDRSSRLKAAAGTFDFDDMLELVDQSLSGPHGELLTGILRQRYRYGLIDEFQDTDEVQWRIFRRLFFEGTGPNRIFLIGDPKQAIYGFRGADVYTYLRARKEIEAAGGASVALTTNYRSTPQLLEAINQLFDQSVPEPLFTGEIRYERPVECGKPDLGAVDAGGGPVPPVVVLEAIPGGAKLSAAGVRRGLGRYIAEETRRLVWDEGDGLYVGPEGARSRVRAKDIFVLTRTSREAQAIAEELRKHGVPFAFYKEGGLFETKEARSIMDLLLAIDAPGHQARRLRAFMTPFFDVPLGDLERCLELPATHPLLVRLLSWRELARAKRYEELFSRILDDSGLIRRELFASRSERDLTNYLHIFELLIEEIGRRRGSLRDLIATLQGYMDGSRQPPKSGGNIQRLESDLDAVQVMTMHKSKGLEAKVVFVAGGFTRGGMDDSIEVYHDHGQRVLQLCDDGRAETREAIASERDEEEQRLLYVALTRAEARLYLPYFRVEPREDGSLGSIWPALEGCYAQINRQITRVLQDHPPASRYETVEVLCPPRRREGAVDQPARLTDWRPSSAAPEAELERLSTIRPEHAGYVITSYSRVKAASGGYYAPDLDAEDLDFAVDRSGAEAGSPSEEQLPGGSTIGVFLHEILELVPLESFSGSPSFETWCSSSEIRAIVAEGMRRYEVDPRFGDQVEQLVYAAYARALPLGEGGGALCLARSDRIIREMEFLYPIPEASHTSIADMLRADGSLTIDRGFVKGFIDLVFEHDGRVYFGDWKSDQLPRWTRSIVTQHVEQNYRLQAQLYTLAMIRALGLEDEAAYEARFGGLIYVFLRGLLSAEADIATAFSRPSWAEMRELETSIIEDPNWGRGRAKEGQS